MIAVLSMSFDEEQSGRDINEEPGPPAAGPRERSKKRKEN